MYPEHTLSDFPVGAATIDERLSDAFQLIPGSKRDCETSLRRLGAWCRHAASGNWIDFARRLERDGLTMEEVLPRLATIRLRQDIAPFAWLVDAEWVASALTGSSQRPADAITAHSTFPFEQLFYELLRQATDRFLRAVATRLHCELPDVILATLRKELLRSVSTLCQDILYKTFDEYRSNQRRSLSRATNSGNTPEIYKEYIARMRSGGLADIFKHYPVCLRLIATVTRQWIDSSAEFLCRLVDDLPIIRHQLAPDASLTRVSHLRLGASDLHHFGRSVCIVTFESSCVVYKPRDVSVEKRWNELISTLNQSAPPFLLSTYRVISLDGYGWCEYIPHRDTQNEEDVAWFFKRAGALLALCYSLNGKDMHGDNLVAAGEHPVLVDLEMLFQPSSTPACQVSPLWQAQNVAKTRISKSILATGLLPTWLLAPDAGPMLVGGLFDRSTKGFRERAWKDINGDDMLPIWIDQATATATNLPRIGDKVVSVADHAQETVEGCDKYLKFLVNQKSKLLDAVDRFRGVQVRRVLRPTQFYHLLTNRLLDFRNMSDGAEWSAIVEFTSRYWSDEEQEPASWALAAQEREQLSDLNTPYFCQRTDEPSMLTSGDMTIEKSTTLMDDVQDTVQRMDDKEIESQLRLLRVSLSMLHSRSRLRHDPESATHNMHHISAPLPTHVAFSIAEEIAASLRNAAILEGGSAAWIGLTPASGDLGWQFSVLGSDLYSGTPGIALFLAALAKLTDSTEWRVLALEALAPWRHVLRSPGAAQFSRLSGISGTRGMGSLLYALCTCAEILDEGELRDDAVAAAALVSDDLIESDDEFDIVGGSAGAILSFLKLYRASNCSFALDRALKCGQHLLQRRPAREKFRGMWHPKKQLPLTGFSHGAAGFAYALTALAAATGESAFIDAAHDCLLYEQDMYAPEHGNWKDLRDFESHSGNSLSYCCQWCHGAAGIGLARIGMLKFGFALSNVTQDLETAIATTRTAVGTEIDSLCCGNMGRIDALIEAAKFLRRQELEREARCQAQAVVDRASKRGGFGWIVGDDRDNLGFFGGIAGLGFTMVRSVYPERLPCILIWE